MKNNFRLFAWILFFIVFGALIYTQRMKVHYRKTNSLIAVGTIVKKTKVAKGERYVVYHFRVNGILYKGNMSIQFCNECKISCCEIGGKVKVRYEKKQSLKQ